MEILTSNSFRPGQHGWYLTDNNFEYIFFNENIWVPSSHSLIIPPIQRSWKGVILVSRCPSVCPSVRPSVCGQNRVRSVSSTILAESISYLHISSSNFRRCVTCKGYCEIPKFPKIENFWQIFWICNFYFVLLWHGIWYESVVRVIMGRWGVFSERKRSSCSS